MPNKRVRSDGRLLPGGLSGKVGAPESARQGLGPASRRLPSSKLPDQQTKLRTRLKTAEETLRAIRSGEVDALMVSGPRGERVVSLKGGEPAYRLLVEAMSEGAATLSRDGALLYCNRRFAELICMPPGKVIGRAIQSLVAETEIDRCKLSLPRLRRLLREANSTSGARMGAWFRSICLLTGFGDTRARFWAW